MAGEVGPLHGYCIRRVGDAPPPPALRGLDGQPVSSVTAGRLAVWVSPVGAERPSPERLRDHDRVVGQALRTATPLPLRFGTLFRDEADAARRIAAEAQRFEADLDRVAGRVEMGLRIATRETALDRTAASDSPGRASSAGLPPDRIERAEGSDAHGPRAADVDGGAEVPPASAGRRYLERRRLEIDSAEAHRRAAGEILAELEGRLGAEEWPCVRTPLASGTLIGTLAHLVQVAEQRHYRERVEALREERPDLLLVVSGPWAPYSFVR